MSMALKEKLICSMKKQIHILLLLFLALSGCKQQTDPVKLEAFCKNQLPQWNRNLTRVIITDIFSPPVCSRIYAYCNIAAYEAMRHADNSYKTYAGVLRGLLPLPSLADKKEKCFYSIAGVIAFSTTAQKLVFNREAMAEMEDKYLEELRTILKDNKLIDEAIIFGKQIGNHITDWAAKDGYLQRTSLPGYFVTKEPGRWQPTPPDYTDAVENNWKTIRPFVLDSASQFRAAPPIKYDTVKGSAFYKQAYEVYKAVKSPDTGDSATAWYWDDNPNTSVTQGHIAYFQQKMSPPGHWIHIACNIASKENYDEVETASLVSQTAIAIFDAIISCWETKYYYNYIRPETFINKYIDKDWLPLIQTPPFPEYTSGHSCISASAATLLTNIAGDKYAFIDSTEVPFGRPVRKFESFYSAADQASISRMYGGIHFKEALEAGNKQGKLVGSFIALKLKK
jgi:PAP2 superfamily